MPDFSLETGIPGRVAGVDEVGRGPLAGPVVAAAVVLDPATFPEDLGPLVQDSKLLTPKRREQVLARLLSLSDIDIGIGAASVREIDRLNILNATMLAMTRAVAALKIAPHLALVDGNQAPSLACPVRTVVRGDGISLSIAAASIVAKVTRDRLMARLAQRHPAYGWERNAGYGTAKHRDALFAHGVTPHHRRSFRPIPHILSLAEISS
ncbi:MAG: ribonuclease HII [Rhodospirillaceae bacterium]|nr:MAG: ribonuclease HII [Rhodospirillaceae bacterium]